MKPNPNPCQHVYLGWDLLKCWPYLNIYVKPVIWSIPVISEEGDKRVILWGIVTFDPKPQGQCKHNW